MMQFVATAIELRAMGSAKEFRPSFPNTVLALQVAGPFSLRQARVEGRSPQRAPFTTGKQVVSKPRSTLNSAGQSSTISNLL